MFCCERKARELGRKALPPSGVEDYEHWAEARNCSSESPALRRGTAQSLHTAALLDFEAISGRREKQMKKLLKLSSQNKLNVLIRSSTGAL